MQHAFVDKKARTNARAINGSIVYKRLAASSDK